MTAIHRLSLLALLAIGATALAACGGGDADDEGDASPTAEASVTEDSHSDEATVAFTLADFEITGPATVAAGSVRIDATNEGAQAHELVIVRSDAATDALPVVDAVVPEDEVDLIGEIEKIPGGEERSSTFVLEAGRYLVICNIPAHYQLGMVSELTVE